VKREGEVIGWVVRRLMVKGREHYLFYTPDGLVTLLPELASKFLSSFQSMPVAVRVMELGRSAPGQRYSYVLQMQLDRNAPPNVLRAARELFWSWSGWFGWQDEEAGSRT
jgi:hypothetical protein